LSYGIHYTFLSYFSSAGCIISYGPVQGVDRIFQFDTIDDGKLKLRDEIKTRDFILVDGSKEMEMAKMVDEIKEM